MQVDFIETAFKRLAIYAVGRPVLKHSEHLQDLQDLQRPPVTSRSKVEMFEFLPDLICSTGPIDFRFILFERFDL